MAPDILALEPKLVSAHCGAIRKLQRVYKDVAEPVRPFIYRAEIANHQFLDRPASLPLSASGKGMDEDQARRSALGEAVERYCALRHPGAGELRFGPAGEVENAVDPRRLVLYAPEQQATLPYPVYHDDLTLNWVGARRLHDQAPSWLPAYAVYLGYTSRDDVLSQQTSNGLAAGATPEAAALGAILEVVERDAFMITWAARLAPTRIEWRSHPSEDIRALAVSYERRGVGIELYRLPTDHDIPVFAALGVEREPGDVTVVVGLGCDLDPAQAAAGAILEVAQVRPALRMKIRDPEIRARRDRLVNEPAAVSELEDHDLLYTDPRMLRAFDTWRSGPVTVADWTSASRNDPPAARLDTLAAHLQAIGATAHVVSITTPDISALGLHVARAVVEDFQPIHFGHQERRLAGQRLWRVPTALTGRPFGIAEFNPLPHPLA